MMRIFDRTRRTRLLVALLLSAAVVLVTIDFRTKGDGPLDAIGRGIMTVIGPIQDAVSHALRPVGNFFAGFTQVPSLKAEIGRLQRDNALLTQRERQVGDITRENDELRTLLGLGRRLALKTSTVRVTGVGPSNFEHTVFIDRGSAEGIRKDMPVIAGAGLVGRVVETTGHTSRVLLLIDPSSAVAARISVNGETGVIAGTGGEQLQFDLFDSEAHVTLSDDVVTSGYSGGVYPAGIPVGTVVRIEPPGGALNRRVWVRPFVDFTSLDYLLVVTGQRATR
jgi:rod shape-determining protein MreC